MKRVAQIGCIVNLLALLSLPAITHADSGFYLGVQVMQEVGDFAPDRTHGSTVAGSLAIFDSSGGSPIPVDLPASSVAFASGEFGEIYLLKGGYHFTERFAVEARYALTDDSPRSAVLSTNPLVTQQGTYRWTTDTAAAINKLSEWYGVYGKLGFRSEARLRPYLLGGYASREIIQTYSSTRIITHIVAGGTEAEVENSIGATITDSSTDTADGLSVGVGLNIGFGKRVDFNVEWLNNDEGGLLFSGPAYSALNAGLVWKF